MSCNIRGWKTMQNDYIEYIGFQIKIQYQFWNCIPSQPYLNQIKEWYLYYIAVEESYASISGRPFHKFCVHSIIPSKRKSFKLQNYGLRLSWLTNWQFNKTARKGIPYYKSQIKKISFLTYPLTNSRRLMHETAGRWITNWLSVDTAGMPCFYVKFYNIYDPVKVNASKTVMGIKIRRIDLQLCSHWALGA